MLHKINMKNMTFLFHVVAVMLFVASSLTLTIASFPETEIVLEMATLSHAVYHLRKKVLSCHSLIHNITDTSNNSTQELPSDIFQRLLPNETSCLYYNHDYSLGRQVLIVRNTQRNYIAVAYSGTDDWRTALSDGNILSKAFGPSSADNNTIGGNNISSIFDTVPSTVRVHSGFNNDVFSNAGFSTVLRCILAAREGRNCDNNDVNNNIIQPRQPYKIYTTGHSLGAASSVILGAALHLAFPSEEIQSINYGSPKIGNFEWSSWIDSLQPNYNSSESAFGEETADQHGTFENFRFVNKIDLVPRLPDVLYFQHAGHTLQMSAGGTVKAYYDHIGNGDLGFAGVPYGWTAAAYVFMPSAIASHMMLHYLDYLQYYKPKTRTSYAVEFEIIDNSTGSDNENNPPGPDDEAYVVE